MLECFAKPLILSQTTMSINPEQLTLYYSPYCPYCHRVLNTLLELGYPADLKNADANGITLKNYPRRQH